ncbi:hypothetical protein [Bradyrhizobium sp. CCBAU 11386]|uniref:hypothetical protein n=1 Tax=Bradyrhizobium sp. CCBAU 11386 TaxID=1630837 RepID=UPI0023021ABD|nr:hypothetical protein [Bradyrhizobium sp. CCBAU 11386]
MFITGDVSHIITGDESGSIAGDYLVARRSIAGDDLFLRLSGPSRRSTFRNSRR